MQVAVTGGTGFIGRDITEILLERGDAVKILTRDASRIPAQFRGHVEGVSWDSLDLGGVDAVINLAGENLFAKRWNEAQKEKILRSRIHATEQVIAAIERAAAGPRVLVNGSAVGYYGSHEDAEFDESSAPADDFLARVCVQWERAAAAARQHGCRVVPIRMGVVLDKNGGALERMLTPFRLFVGGPAGSGRQWMSWVHRRDVSRLFAFAIDHESLDEPLNATSPQPTRMSEFAKTLGKVLGRPSWLPAPGFALKLALGEVSDVILKGQRVLPKRTQEVGFEFEYPDLKKALEEILTEEVVP